MTQENTVATVPVQNREIAEKDQWVLLEQQDGSIVPFKVLDVASGRLRIAAGIFWKDTGYEFRKGDSQSPGRRIVNPTPQILAKIEQQNQKLRESFGDPTVPTVAKVEPIRPDQVRKIDVEAKIITIWNKLIRANWNGLNAIVTVTDMLQELVIELKVRKDDILNLNIWNINRQFQEAGWIVKYRREGFEDNQAYVFTPAKPLPKTEETKGTEEDIPF